MMFSQLPFHPIFIPMGFCLLMVFIGIIFKVGPFARKDNHGKNSTRDIPSQDEDPTLGVLDKLKNRYKRGEISRERYKILVEEYYEVMSEE